MNTMLWRRYLLNVIFLLITSRCQSSEECDDVIHNAEECYYHGTLACGICQCSVPYIGRNCEIDSTEFEASDATCRSSPNAPVCSGRGTCVYGQCHCAIRDKPDEVNFVNVQTSLAKGSRVSSAVERNVVIASAMSVYASPDGQDQPVSAVQLQTSALALVLLF
ncbi:integrin [Halocaridina rubra]|uniref:Integrin n=1 Tax=Halocaridina rubra TaxID=373956 RepID=A0AAN8ZYC0_HALRR